MTPFARVKVEWLSRYSLTKHDKKNWIHTKDCAVRISTMDDEDSWVLPIKAGTLTDKASVPKVPILFLLFGDKGEAAAVIHDQLYALGYPREYSDMVFYCALANEVNDIDQFCMWLGVRLGGGFVFEDGSLIHHPTMEIEAP